MDTIEFRTRQIGRELLRRVRQSTQDAGPLTRLHDRALTLVMADDALKSSLFRLVDVLPALTSAAPINRHLREYLNEVAAHLPPALAWTAGRIPLRGPPAWAIAAAARQATSRLARAFIAAESPAAFVQRRRENFDFTIDLLGEAVVSETEADYYATRYHDLIDTLAAQVSSPNVSIKLSSLYSQFDPIDVDGSAAAVLRRLRPILRRARDRGVFVCFDMEQSACKDLTIALFKQILTEADFLDWPSVGIAIQAYLPASHADLADLADWSARRRTPVWVRLVKGAYWDYECVVAGQNNWPVPVYTQKAETDANFERLAEFLIERHGVLRPAIASHNVRDIAKALALAEAYHLPPRTLEFQMLHGMAAPIKAALIERGQRVRVYAPVGNLLPGMAYLVRRLLENTSNQSFLRAALLEHVPDEELLMNPATVIDMKPKNSETTDRFVNEPPTDFSRGQSRDALRAALARLGISPSPDTRGEGRGEGLRRPLIINGQKIPTADWLPSINPSHKSQPIGRCAKATADHALSAIAAAKAAFPAWRDQSPQRRAQLLLDVAAILRRRRFDLAALEVAECGKPWREADADITEAIDFCRYYAAQALRLFEPNRADLPGETNQHFHEPRGVVAVISPWNFPLAIPCGMLAAAVVTGNTAILKPAEQSGLIAAELIDAFQEAGAPAGVANYLPGIGEEIGPVLVAGPDVDMIAFTGSRAVGLAIHEQAARTPPGQLHIKRVIAEMGGKNAIILDSDADLDDAIHGITASAFGYAGQKCSACSRLIVLDEIYNAFVPRLIEAVKGLRLGPAEDAGCFLGPVIDAEAYARIRRTVEQAKTYATLAYAGDPGPLAAEGFYIPPHIFTGVLPDSPLAQNEIFGPVLAVLKACHFDDALRIANAVPYALTGGVYSRSPEHIAQARREFRVGDLYINRKITGALVGRQPFGGFKLSGMGAQAGGPDYLPQFVQGRVITENTLRHGFVPE